MKRVLQLAATLLIGLGLMWLASGFSARGALYDSVHSMGQRFGSVLPMGFDPTNFLPSQQVMRSERTIWFSNPDRLPVHLNERIVEQQRAERAQALRYRFMVWGAASGCVLVVLGSLYWTTRGASPGGGVPTLVVRAGVLVVLVGLLCVVGFTQARVFWTGVDDALIERSSQLPSGSGSGPVRVVADGTLDMSIAAFWALLGAVVLTAIPLMFLSAGWVLRSAQRKGSGVGGTRGGVLMQQVCQYCARMHMRWVGATGRLAVVSYALVVLCLWTAPWSITVVRALLRS